MSTAVTALTHGNDLELVERVLNGEPDLFEQIVHRYHRPIVQYVFRMVGDYEAALDLTQEVFIKLYKSLDRYDTQYRFSTWLFRIASNHAIDYLRKQHGHLCSLDESSSDLTPTEVVSREPSPERQSILNERRTLMEAIVEELPVRYRQVIVLRHVAEFDYEEIAEITGWPLGTVKNQIFRAREAIRRKLMEVGIDGSE